MVTRSLVVRKPHEKMTDSFRVELRDVTKRFGETIAVDNLTLQIRDGEFFSLIGPSGCGKTTTLRMVAGFEQPSEGTICLPGFACSQFTRLKVASTQRWRSSV